MTSPNKRKILSGKNTQTEFSFYSNVNTSSLKTKLYLTLVFNVGSSNGKRGLAGSTNLPYMATQNLVSPGCTKDYLLHWYCRGSQDENTSLLVMDSARVFLVRLFFKLFLFL